jgi:hypothetical protein
VGGVPPFLVDAHGAHVTDVDIPVPEHVRLKMRR